MSGAVPQTLHTETRRFDDVLRRQMRDDPRLASGIPATLRGDDLAFIRLTGMTRPAALDCPVPLALADPPPLWHASAAAQGFREIILMLGGTPVDVQPKHNSGRE